MPDKEKTLLAQCVADYAAGLDALRPGLGDQVREIPLEPRDQDWRDIVFGVGSGTTATHLADDALTHIGLTGMHWDLNDTWTHDLVTIMGRCAHKDALVCRLDRHEYEYHFGTFSSAEIKECRDKLNNFPFTSLSNKLDYVTDEPIDQLFLHLYLAFPNAKFILSNRPAEDYAEQRHANHTGGFAPIQDPCGDHVLFYSKPELAAMLGLHNDLVRCIVPSWRLFEYNLWTDPAERSNEIATKLGKFAGLKWSANWTDFKPTAHAHASAWDQYHVD